MSANRRNGIGLSKQKYQARFESLESRRCLSASALKVLSPAIKPSVSTTSPITTQGHSLTVKDTGSGDTITVTDDGAGDVSVTITNGLTQVATGSGTGITNVCINASGGDETVDYNLDGALTVSTAVKTAVRPSTTSHESISINVSKGGNTVNFADPNGLTGASLNLDINATGGSNTVNVNGGVDPTTTLIDPLGNLTNSNLSLNISTSGTLNGVNESFGALTGSRLFSTFEGFGGSDTLDASLSGDLSGSQAFFAAFGGGGSNNLGLTISGDIAADSLLSAQLAGSFKGGDTIGFAYTGTLDGKLYAGTTGAGGNETITQTLTVESGSTGSLHSLIADGKGSTANKLTLNLTDDSNGGDDTAASTLKTVKAAILDQSGDTVVQNVSPNDTGDVTLTTQKGHGWFFGWLGFGWGW